MWAIAGRGDDIADLHIGGGDNDAVNEEFDESAALGEGGGREASLDRAAEGGQAGGDAGEVALLLGAGFELALLRLQPLIAPP